MATAAPCASGPPSTGSSRSATTGSPTAPMPIDANVIPTWQAEMYSLMLSTSSSASAAPRAPSSAAASSLGRRARTSEYSATTKKAFRSTRTRTAMSSSAVKRWSLRRGRRARRRYFEEGRRRSSRRPDQRYQGGPASTGSARALGQPQPAHRPQREERGQPERGGKREQYLGGRAGDESAAGLEQGGHRVHARDRLDPAGEQVQRHVHRGREEDQEDRDLHERAGLDRAEAKRDAERPQSRRGVDDERQADQPGHVGAVAVDVHPADRRRGGHDGAREQRARQAGQEVARDDGGPVRGRQQQAPAEAVLEVGGHRKAGEDPAEGGGLEQHEHELECRVTSREVEVRRSADRREAAREGEEEEEREDERRQDQRRVGEDVVQVAPGDREHNPSVAMRSRHVRTSLVRRARLASTVPTAIRPRDTAKPSASASPSQPVINSERTASIR